MKKFLILLFISSLFLACSRNWHIADAKVEYHRFDKNTDTEISEIDSLIAPYKEQLDLQLSEIVLTLDNELVKEKPEGTLTNFAADLLKSQAEIEYGENIDFAVLNYGGLRINSLASGPVSKRKFFELMPFENLLVILHASGSTVLQLCDKIADYGGWPISDELHFTIHDGKAQNITINGRPLELSKNYNIALPDFISNGNDNCEFLVDIPQTTTSLLIRDALIQSGDRLNDMGKGISVSKTGRIKIE